jgi:hypothetical protein
MLRGRLDWLWKELTYGPFFKESIILQGVVKLHKELFCMVAFPKLYKDGDLRLMFSTSTVTVKQAGKLPG